MFWNCLGRTFLAVMGAGRVRLKSQLGHLLATGFTSLNFSFSVSFSKDECQGLLRAGHRAHHSARHTGGPQLERLPALFTSLPGLPPGMASLIDKARPQFWHPDRLLEATTERCLAAPGQLPLSRGSYCSSQPQARGSKTPGRQGKQASCGAGEPVPLLRSKGCESGTSR